LNLPAIAARQLTRVTEGLPQVGLEDPDPLVDPALGPAGFWAAAARFAGPGEAGGLARAAENRGLLRDAARLRRHATDQGNAREAAALVSHWPHAADPNPAQWAAARAALDDPVAVAMLLRALRETGAEQQAAHLATRAAAHAPIDKPVAVATLLKALRDAGAEQQAAHLLARDPATHAPIDSPSAVASLLGALRDAGAEQQAAHLVTRAAAHAPIDNPYGVATLLSALRETGAEQQAAHLLAATPPRTPHRQPIRRRHAAQGPAGDRRGTAGWDANRPTAGRRTVQSLPRATWAPVALQVRT
jgi:hypothetical protein